jgi:anaerobic ribonucleoside-triphosphate reductase activating protein
MIRLSASLQPDSIVDGPGLRTVIWTQGCTHNCPGCHNPQTHSLTSGFLENKDLIANQILQLGQNITFSGGDPFLQPEQCSYIARVAKENGLNVWCYTGFTFESLLKMSLTNKDIDAFLKNIDVLVDGPFILSKRDLSLKFRGSTNQRIIDVKKSLSQNRIIILNEDSSIDSLVETKKEFL